MLQNTMRLARSTGLVAAVVVCLLLMQAHTLLHAGSTIDCKVCTGNLWTAPEPAPDVASLTPAQWNASSPHPGHIPENDFHETAPRAPPAV